MILKNDCASTPFLRISKKSFFYSWKLITFQYLAEYSTLHNSITLKENGLMENVLFAMKSYSVVIWTTVGNDKERISTNILHIGLDLERIEGFICLSLPFHIPSACLINYIWFALSSRASIYAWPTQSKETEGRNATKVMFLYCQTTDWLKH